MSSHLNRVQNFTKVKKYEFLKLTWDSHVSSHLNRVLEFEFKKNKKIQVPKTHVRFSGVFSSESSFEKKVKKYKFLKPTWDSQVSSHLNRVQNFTKVKEYEFLKLTWDSHVSSHLNWVFEFEFKNIKKYKFLKRTWVSHVYSHLNRVLKKK